jgi:hypothetical protein
VIESHLSTLHKLVSLSQLHSGRGKRSQKLWKRHRSFRRNILVLVRFQIVSFLRTSIGGLLEGMISQENIEIKAIVEVVIPFLLPKLLKTD